jgi:phytoene dehydrogenase-like protein
MNRYDAIIVGGGHNGLITAAYLGRAGKKVLVLERRDRIGGAAVTEEIYPGFFYSPCAQLAGGFSPRIIRDLGLQRFGLKFLQHDPLLLVAAPDGQRLLFNRDADATAGEIRRFSPVDAAHYPDFSLLVRRLAAFLGRLWTNPPLDPSRWEVGDILRLIGIGLHAFGLSRRERLEALRVLPMSLADFLDEHFATELLKAALAGSGILGAFAGPRAQGTAHLFLHHLVGSDGPVRSRGLVRGGIGKLSSALGDAARGFGVEIRTAAEVKRLLIKNGRVRGVALQDGGEIMAQAVAASVDLRKIFLDLVPPAALDPTFRARVESSRFKGASSRVHFAVKKVTNLKGEADLSSLHGLIQIGHSLDYLERAYDDAKYGGVSRRPFLEIMIPSLADPSLAPAGRHVVSVLVQYTPYHLKEGTWRERKEELGDTVAGIMEDYFPGFADTVLHRHVVTPLDLEEDYGLTHGDAHHGQLSLDQLFFMRPTIGWSRYRTPIKNLYLCGASAHPGAGVTGAPGYNAARQILKDWREIKRGLNAGP